MRLFLVFFKYHVKERMEYRAAFLIGAFAQIIAYAANYLVVWMLMQQFETINGWTWPEVAFLYSTSLFVYAIGASFTFVQMQFLEDMVRDGTFDTILIKPRNPYFYFVTSTFNNAYIAHLLLSGSILVWSLGQLGFKWDLFNIIFFILCLISGSLIIAGMLTIIGSLTFKVVRLRFLFSLFNRMREFISYPISIYHFAIQVMLIFIIPMAFVNFVPSSLLLGKDMIVMNEIAYIAPFVGPVLFYVSYKLWMRNVNHYQGAGG